ncbi:MAG TPA: metal ABC transporter ATP-binding protein [Candidatus Binatia bacterium]|jgi:zinc/manganese transport system ATP-binding protein/zinc transport system ATP-binding protein
MANPHDHRPGDPHSLHPSNAEEGLWHRAEGVALVELAHVSNGYGSTPALTDVSLKIWPGQFMAIVGPNGGGKTTLLRTILGMVPMTLGKVLLRGQSLKQASLERIGYVPQLETIDWNFPITVEEVIAMGFFVKNGWFGGIGEKEKRKLHEVMQRLNLDGLGKRHIRELSGGQQQAVFIGRALLGEPELILLDEPASGLDIRSRDDVIHFLHEINHTGVAIVITAHDLNWVAAHLPWAVCLNHKLIAEGRPNQVFTAEVLQDVYSGELVVLHQDGMVMIGERPHAPHN